MKEKLANNPVLSQKIKATTIHLCFSAVLMLLSAGLIFGLWYKQPFYTLYQVSPVFSLLLIIDLIIGPLLTFIVYQQGKKTLKMDLAVIIVLQLAAWLWGMLHITEARPAWLVIYHDQAYAVSPADYTNPQKPIEQFRPKLWQQNWGQPKLVMAANNRDAIEAIYNTTGYLPYDALTVQRDRLVLAQIKKADGALYQQIQHDYPSAQGYLPVITDASYDLPLILLDESAQPIATVVAKNKLFVKQ
ncbi:hypothetical protein [Faucicola atlantae]|uniref:Type IV pilin accessory protein n=1 Tax=Faucicola atlantae TaxID=34059 RepID=A0A1B8QL05_9GAMM|nr:hypothetical protein [Moraxella atlantae]OBX84293.1 hypothetical protein A9306_03365 [Moraxella atlantae]